MCPKLKIPFQIKKTLDQKDYTNKVDLSDPKIKEDCNISLKNHKQIKAHNTYEASGSLTLEYLILYLNNYVSKFCEIEVIDDNLTVCKDYKSKELFKIIYCYSNNTNQWSDLKDKIIIMNLIVKDKRITEAHNCNIVKGKDNIYYHNSCNYKTIVSKFDFDNFNIQNILDESKKVGNYPFEYEHIKYYVELI